MIKGVVSMKIHSSIGDLIGNTPLIELKNIALQENLCAKLVAKLEFFNPAGSVKDRVAYNMIMQAESKGLLKEGSVIIEPTSGNTGIGLAAVGASRGYKVILTMPDTMSIERRNLLKAYGAEVELTDGSRGMLGAIEKAEELATSIPNSFIPGQFVNDDNSDAHKTTTGPEKSPIFITANELEMSEQNPDNYYLYRVYNFDSSLMKGDIAIRKGSLKPLCTSAQTYKVEFK